MPPMETIMYALSSKETRTILNNDVGRRESAFSMSPILKTVKAVQQD